MKRLSVLVFLAVGALYAATPTVIAIHNARVIPVSGPDLARGTVILRNGLIEAVGADIPVPADAWVIEGDGLTVYPGMIDALSTFGIPDAAPATTGGGGRGGGGGQTPAAVAQTQAAPAPTTPPARGPEDRPSTTSWLKAADLVKSTDHRLDAARAEGFTTALTFPPRGIFPGQGPFVHLPRQTPPPQVLP